MTRQGSFNLGGLSEENWIRIQEQNEKPSASSSATRRTTIGKRIGTSSTPTDRTRKLTGESVIPTSGGQRTKDHQYDMYKRFLRWASDRLDDDGIIGVITNRAYLDTYQDDGFRKVASEEFTDIYVMDLGSDVRRNPKIPVRLTTYSVYKLSSNQLLCKGQSQKRSLRNPLCAT